MTDPYSRAANAVLLRMSTVTNSALYSSHGGQLYRLQVLELQNAVDALGALREAYNARESSESTLAQAGELV